MSIVARQNPKTGGSKSYSESAIDTVSWVDKDGNTSSSQRASASHVVHMCSRDAARSMPLVSAGGGRKRIRLSSNFARTVRDFPLVPVSYKHNWKSGAKRRYTDTFHVGIPYSQIEYENAIRHDEDARNQAVTQALNKLGDMKVNMSTALAEARSTYNMLADNSIALWRSYRNIRRGRFRDALGDLGLSGRRYFTGMSSASAILQIKYGWMPLLNDMYAGYQWFTENHDKPLILNVSSASNRSRPVTYNSGRWNCSGQVSTRAICGIKAHVTGDFSRFMSQAGMINPALLAWELIPYSFVIDWWMPIGNVLQTYSDSSGLSFIDGYVSTISEAHASCNYSYHGEDAVETMSMSGSGTYDWFSFSRTGLRTWPRPGAYTKANWFNKNKGLTALALFRTAIG